MKYLPQISLSLIIILLIFRLAQMQNPCDKSYYQIVETVHIEKPYDILSLTFVGDHLTLLYSENIDRHILTANYESVEQVIFWFDEFHQDQDLSYWGDLENFYEEIIQEKYYE